MVRDRSLGSTLFDVFNHLALLLAGLMCILPLIHIIAVSFSDRASTSAHLVSIWPVNFSTYNYEWVMRGKQFVNSAMISLMRVAAGGPLVTLVTFLAAYPLSIKQDFPGKQVFKWMLIFSMLFSGGLIPYYMVIKQVGLLNNIWGLILPGLVAPFYIILVLNFFRGLPVEMAEAAEMDGASHLDILFRIYLPTSLPVLATVFLFAAVGHWNSWFDGLIIMSKVTNYPLMTYLQTQFLTSSNQIASVTGLGSGNLTPEQLARLSDRAIRGAMIVLTTLPILALYPFLQKYFVAGLTIGSVKG